ncbi:hypothetical protein NHP190020_10480 [Helicobacter suis]|uniref:Uncharacterized protein n=1 Tax=Helicobacter suis TaxID=104628 RepID=A0ABM7L009_9HELI|nr:hypothetical protein NHP190020_10480 [Helicobacter suis]BCD50969.1 hypothetical protein NHP194022_06400 [Helicobacter suis]
MGKILEVLKITGATQAPVKITTPTPIPMNKRTKTPHRRANRGLKEKVIGGCKSPIALEGKISIFHNWGIHVRNTHRDFNP